MWVGVGVLLAGSATQTALGVCDCNGNGYPDLCDLSCAGSHFFCPPPAPEYLCSETPFCGQSNDCNSDSVPDECQLTDNDCNSNFIPDDCEADCDGDGTPDDCDSDIDGDGVANDNDLCDYSPSTLTVDTTGKFRGSVRADLDGDCDVDDDDWDIFNDSYEDGTGDSTCSPNNGVDTEKVLCRRIHPI